MAFEINLLDKMLHIYYPCQELSSYNVKRKTAISIVGPVYLSGIGNAFFFFFYALLFQV